MAQSERCVRSLPELLIEENQKRETEKRPTKQVSIVAIAGTNGSGKSSIATGLEHMLPTAYYRTDLRRGENPHRDDQLEAISGWYINFFREPTPEFPIRNSFNGGFNIFGLFPKVEGGDSYRDAVMKSGLSSFEAFALFTQGRRRIQEWLACNPFRGNRLCVLDRSSEATLVHQIMLNADPTLAGYLKETLLALHQTGYFLPYQQTFLVLPNEMKLREYDDDPHTNLGELDAYKRIMYEGLLDSYCRQTFWVENDPLGKRNMIALPTYVIAAAIYAGQVFGRLRDDQEYKLHLPLWGTCRWLDGEGITEISHYGFSNLMDLLEGKWVETGNLAIKYETKDQTTLLRVTDRLP